MFTLGRRPALDGVRAVAILAVIGFHFRSPGAVGTRGGFLGVQMFFVLSGFLITSLLLDEQKATGIIRLGAFYARRALRLLPALFTMVAVVLIYAGIAYLDVTSTLREALYAIGYSDNWYRAVSDPPYTPFSHTWSLSLEEQFYIVWPLLLVIVLLRRPRVAVAVAGCGAVAEALVRAYSWHASVTALRALDGVDGILLGCCLALALNLGIPAAAAKLIERAFVPALLLVAAMFLFADSTKASVQELGVFAFSSAVAVMLYNIVARRTWLNSVLEWKPIRFIGGISYALYLWHYPIYGTLTGYMNGGVAVVALALTFAFAIASMYVVERPFLRLKSRVGRREAVEAVPAAIAG